jgi:ABC-type Fe3+/spermidine/putrescine transport system ATPase subunit
MRNGRIEANRRTAGALSPTGQRFRRSVSRGSNILRGKIVDCAAGTARLATTSLGTEIIGPCASGLAIGMEAGAIFRPEAVGFAGNGEVGLPARVIEVVYLGELLAIRLALPSGQEVWRRCFPGTEDPVEGSDVRLSWRTEDVRIVPLDNQPMEEN